MAETINTQTTGCVGIEKIEQTYEGLFDNKPNIITIYLTNGDTHQFKVMNGSQGVGIDRIEQRQTSTVSGGRNEFAIILTNGKEYTFSTYNGSGGSGSSGSFNQVLQQLNNLLMPSGKSYLYYNGSGFEWKSPDGSTGGGTADLSEYSWWGRKFDPASKSITGEMSGVTGIEFQSANGKKVIRKKLHLDKNGDLCFDGNLYATGGITALGSGGGTSGGSSASLGTLLTKLNSENPFPTASGQVLTYDGSNFIWKTPTGSGVALNPTMSAMNDQLDKTSYGTPQFLYWDGSTYTWKNESEISGDGGSIQVAKEAEQGYSEQWYDATKLRFVGIGGTQITVSPNSIKNCVDVGIPTGNGSSRIKKIKLFNSHSDYSFETIDLGTADTIGFMAGNNVTLEAVVKEYTNVIKISASGGSGSSGTTAGSLTFYKDGSAESWNGEDNFKIIFGSGLNVDWDTNHKYITLSASGGSGGSTSTSVSWSDVTNKPSTFTPSSHTHSTSDIKGLSNYLQNTKVDSATNADKAKQLANPRLIWGQSFNGTGNINGHLYMGTAGGDSIQLYMNNGNMLDRTNNTLHIGNGLKESSDGEISLDAYITRIYTDNMTRHYDFKSNVFDVNTNAIHFGSGASGGKISWDRANNAFKIEGNVYATGGITALGVSNNATTSNNVDFTFRSVTSPTYNFSNGSYLTEASDDKINTLKLYHANSNQYICLCDSYENIGDDNFLGTIIDSNCMSFMNADWYYFDNSVVAHDITTKSISFCDESGNQGAILSDIFISKVSSQTRLVFTIDDIQYYVNAN